MSFSASNYFQKLAQAQYSDYVSSYSALNEVLRTASIHPQRFNTSRVQFFDQPVTQLTIDGQRYTRAPLGARGGAGAATALQRVNFTRNADYQFNYLRTMAAGANADTQQAFNTSEHIKFWLGFSTACGPFQQFTICKDNAKLWDTSIYA
ncbi:MAG: hypothetical protein EZS28_006277 [Streblomastix strix]|uniref:Uncharacterized protein n=1 Tax=Streblomastix strix TaxID=222440 RepID=A0A5J4WTA4_9EUKA|nr:MAG: hypothetical protein EZS28_006277 [Streblomastix strix]